MSADWIQGFATGVFLCLFTAAAVGVWLIFASDPGGRSKVPGIPVPPPPKAPDQ